MSKLLEQAMAKVAALPAETQERIGWELLAHVEKVNALRGVLQKGINSLDQGKGRELDLAEVIGRCRRGYGGR
jgi:hypothetical protein